MLQLATTTCLALTLIYGPGLLWFLSRPRTAGEFAVALLAGPLALVVVGLACWALGGWPSRPPSPAVSLGVLLVILALWGRRIRKKKPAALPRGAAAVIGVGALLVGFAVAKSQSILLGPPANFTAARIPHAGSGRALRQSHSLLHGADRCPPLRALCSPVPGIFFSLVVRQSAGRWPDSWRRPSCLQPAPMCRAACRDQAWQPFDPQGFAVYRHCP